MLIMNTYNLIMKIIYVNIVTNVSNCAIKYKSIDDVFKIEINVDLKQII